MNTKEMMLEIGELQKKISELNKSIIIYDLVTEKLLFCDDNGERGIDFFNFSREFERASRKVHFNFLLVKLSMKKLGIIKGEQQ